MSRSRGELLSEALHHLELAQEHSSRSPRDQVVIDALCMRLSAGIEVLARLDSDVRDGLFGQTWPLMWGLRNRIAHGYLLVDPAIVEETVRKDLPLILGRVRKGIVDAEAAGA